MYKTVYKKWEAKRKSWIIKTFDLFTFLFCNTNIPLPMFCLTSWFILLWKFISSWESLSEIHFNKVDAQKYVCMYVCHPSESLIFYFYQTHIVNVILSISWIRSWSVNNVSEKSFGVKVSYIIKNYFWRTRIILMHFNGDDNF